MTLPQTPPALPTPHPLAIGEWRIEPLEGVIWRDENKIPLEPRVMALLLYLAEHAGQVVSRDELETEIWLGRPVSYDALTSSIQKLRKAFNDDARQPQVIETLSKRGYRLIAPVTHPPPSASPPTSTPATRQRAIRSRLLPIAIMVLILIAVLLINRDTLWQAGDTADDVPTTPISIAVLPFENLSQEGDQAFFSDGMTDDLITELAKRPDLFVISRESSFLYKQPLSDIREIARRLHVRYLLTGSIRRADNKVRFNVRLLDGIDGHPLWAERYDGALNQLFALQDRITRDILSALNYASGGSETPVVSRQSVNSEAYDQFLLGRNQFFKFASKPENRNARQFYQQAIALDPNFAAAYAMLGWTYAFDAMNGWADDREQALNEAQRLAGQALSLDPNLPTAYFVSGLVYREQGQYMKALAEVEKTLTFAPNYANAHVLLATLLYYTGSPQEGLEKIKKAMRLNPHHPYNYPFHLGQAYFILGDYQQAIDAFNQGLQSNPSSERLHVWLAAAYAKSGQVADAKWEIDQVLTLNPDFSLERIKRSFPFKNPADLDPFIEGLRIAGLRSAQ